MPDAGKTRTRRLLVIGSAVAATWIVRGAWHRLAANSSAFTGSADAWPPVVHAGTRDKLTPEPDSPPPV